MSQPQPQPRPQARTPRRELPLEEVLAEIGRDVRDRPTDYLERARIPGGGE